MTPRISAPASFSSGRRFNVYAKFQLFALLFVGLTTLETVEAQSSTFWSTNKGRQCVCGYDEAVDYFPVKVSPKYATGFTVAYEKHYKIIELPAVNKKFYAYLCGTPKPDNLPDGAVAVEIPVRNVGTVSTTMIPFIEYIRQRDTLDIVSIDEENIYSPCMKKLIQSGETLDTTSTGKVTVDQVVDQNVHVLFSGPWSYANWDEDLEKDPRAVNTTNVPFLHGSEKNVLADAEWVEFASLFFNREEAAVDIVENIKLRYDCTKAIAEKAAESSKTNPAVLYGYYYETGDAWYMGLPETYYDQIITDAGGKLLVGDWVDSFGHTTTEELLTFIEANTIDVFIFTDDHIADMAHVAVQNVTAAVEKQTNRIYDVYRHKNAWFQTRPAEPDIMLQDFVKAIQPTANIQHTRYYLRDVTAKEEIIVSSASECDDPNGPLFTNWKASGCSGEKVVIPGLDVPLESCGELGSSTDSPTTSFDAGASVVSTSVITVLVSIAAAFLM